MTWLSFVEEQLDCSDNKSSVHLSEKKGNLWSTLFLVWVTDLLHSSVSTKAGKKPINHSKTSY